jgi:LysR family hydrogen peroxide-inducible transcriptional activator
MGRSFRYKDIQLTQLRSFCIAATRQNFTTTAEVLGLSTSTVWEQVRALEQKLGAVLFRQGGRTVELTPEGQVLLELVQPHINGLDSLERLFKARRAQLPQQLTVASTQYLLRYHLPRPIQEFTAARPGIHLNVDTPGAEVMPLVEKGAAELAVAPYDPEKPRSPSLDYEDLFELPLMLLTLARHPLARKKQVNLGDLVAHPLILPAQESYSRRVINRIMHRQGFTGPLNVVMETLTFDTIQKYVALGVGVAVSHMSGDTDQAMDGLHFRVLDPALERLPVALIVRKYAHLSKPVEEFCRLVRKHLKSGRGARS